ncbi:membrane protein [Streptomyces daghestanicus]|uniref:Membrane protein n=1 Tax=Streptomyces daghestanicus TaxID=66885 RepID=A0ABQ3Q1L7_9ACTN|nr:membrane protein [Streptomyces griseoviridis]GGU40770.1 membrane protein [Streptomyces daghestanicus]GHI31178.1 membrane protein [Streptomyces daghestanicus]
MPVSIPPPPHPVWGQPSYGPPRPAPVNGVAISALVLGLLCFLPAVGLVLGLIALTQIKRRGERGKGFAVAGTVLSSAGLVLWAVALTTGGASAFWEGFKGAATGEGTAYSLETGQCFDTPDGSLQGVTYDVEEVPCAGAHDGEVFAVFDLPEGPFPGDDPVGETADDRCYALRSGYAMDTWAVPGNVDVYYLTPTRQSWRLGDREVTCLFGGAEEGDVLTGSLRNDETTLDADQLAFLRAAALLDEAVGSEPLTSYVEDDLPGYRKWAGRMADALAGQAAGLREHTWPAAAERPVADLADDLDAARKEWAGAARATDADTFYVHYDTGYELLAPSGSVTARKALGLATTPPSYEDDGEEEGGTEGDPGFEV